MSSLLQKANRILTMIPLIRSQPGIRIEELAAQLGVPARTVLSDLNSALMCGVPPYSPESYIGVYIEHGCVRIDFADHFRRPVALTAIEALSLRLALEHLPARAQNGPRAARRSGPPALISKLDRFLPGRLRPRLSKRFRIPAGGAAQQQRVQTIAAAVAQSRAIDIEYYTASRDVMARRTVNPYGLIEHQGQWYLIAFCRTRRRELPFRVDRIRSVRLTDETFAVPDDFDIETYRRAEMYFPATAESTVEVRVSPERARQLRALKPDESARMFGGRPAIRSLQPQPDGGLLITLAVSRPEWIVSWALEHADSVEILSPPEIRARLLAACTALLTRYQMTGPRIRDSHLF